MPDARPLPIDLKLSDVTKVYPGVVALEGVDLAITAGEVVGLIGENGAGKSTLMGVLGGTLRPESGRIFIDGEELPALTPAQATSRGIAFVHQELNTFDNLDVAANVLLGRELTRGRLNLLDRQAMVRRVQPILDLLGARFAPDDPTAELTLADRQLLEIARALSMDARLVILDEPTSCLTASETERLLGVIRQLKGRGVAVLFISHRLTEVERVADRVLVMRDGRNAGELAGDAITRDAMVRLMIGRDISRFYERSDDRAGAPVLEFRKLRTRAFPDVAVDLDVRAGEILGLAGLAGSGRTDLALAAFGVVPAVGGEIWLRGSRLDAPSVAAAIAAGLCLVPENRKEHGLFLDFAISENIGLPNLSRLNRNGFIDRAGEWALATASKDRLAIKAASLSNAAAELSGGNQQKVVLAKWLAMEPKVIIFDEPTRGIDVGAKAEVYHLMRALADEGVGILMISSDMEEVIGVSNRVAVMCRGRLAGILDAAHLTEQSILDLAIG
jgi:ribose transport system ATP-binding protein